MNHVMVLRDRLALLAPVLMIGGYSLVMMLPAIAQAQQPAALAPLVFDGVTVIDVAQGKPLANQRVVVVGNRIQAVGAVSAVPMPLGARVVDAQGKYLIPGLWDMHVHPWWHEPSISRLLLANGVTGTRDPLSTVPFDTLLLWRREVLTGTRVGPPRQILSGPGIHEQGSPWCGRLPGGAPCITDSAAARRLVDSLKVAGVDMLKTYGLSRAMYFFVAAEARRRGIPFGGHVWGARVATAIEASDSGARILDHLESAADLNGVCLPGVPGWLSWSDGTLQGTLERCQPVAERFRRNGTWWVPTLLIQTTKGTGRYAASIREYNEKYIRAFWDDSTVRPYSLPILAAHDSAKAAGGQASRSGRTRAPGDSLGLLSLVQRTGLPLLAGTDAIGHPEGLWGLPAGFSLHAELAIYVGEGFTPLEALQTATLNPAKFLGSTDSLGTVAPGKLADLVLLDADPLADIANTTTIRAVVANGRYYDRAMLDRLLTEVRAMAKTDTAFEAWRPKERPRRSSRTP